MRFCLICRWAVMCGASTTPSLERNNAAGASPSAGPYSAQFHLTTSASMITLLMGSPTNNLCCKSIVTFLMTLLQHAAHTKLLCCTTKCDIPLCTCTHDSHVPCMTAGGGSHGIISSQAISQAIMPLLTQLQQGPRPNRTSPPLQQHDNDGNIIHRASSHRLCQ